jgi:ABC-type uncharacterized transport system involved in gliding motility auxiliary subunit
VSGLDDLLTLKLFASADLPAQMSLVHRDVNDFLDDLASSSPLVRVVRSQPTGGSAEEFWAQRAGVSQVDFSVAGPEGLLIKRGYLGLAVTYLDHQEVIQFIQSTESLEYQVASMVNTMVKTDRKTVAFLAGHGERSVEADLQALTGELARQYAVRQVQATEDGSLDLGGVDVLVVAGPTEEVPQGERDALDRYLAGGRSALVLVDQVMIGGFQGGLAAQRNTQSFDTFLAPYGVTVADNLVQDARFNGAMPIGGGPFALPLPYQYWPRATALDSQVTGDVESVVLLWASSLEVAETPGLLAMPLLESSRFASLESPYFDVTPGQAIAAADAELGPRLLGVAVTGPGAPGGSEPGGRHRLVVVGDSDWVTDAAASLMPENIVLALNMIDWLAQEDALAAIRSRGATSGRLLFTSPTHRNMVQYGNVIGVPLLLVVVGAVRFLRRRAVTRRVYTRGS